MQSKAKDVTMYIEEAPVERQEVLRRRSRPCSQKHFIGLYILRTDVMAAHKGRLHGTGINVGKGTIRYSKAERIDFDVVESMLRGTVKSTGPVC